MKAPFSKNQPEQASDKKKEKKTGKPDTSGKADKPDKSGKAENKSGKSREKSGPVSKSLWPDEGFLLNDKSPFAMQEAYKTLRTNVIFSIPEAGCRRILLTSSVQGEGKSTTAINLAIAFAQNKNRILLVDADMRLPVDATRLGVPTKPGLSNYLIGMCKLEDCIHSVGNGLDIVPAGDVPPNPTELLGSAAMDQFISAISERYEYVIFDSPPVCTVADASVLARHVSGAVLVVRQHVATRESVRDALETFRFSETKVLGTVFTGVQNEKMGGYGKGYGRYGKYGKYGRYGGRYGKYGRYGGYGGYGGYGSYGSYAYGINGEKGGNENGNGSGTEGG